MEKYLKRLCDNIVAGSFNYENYLSPRSYYGVDIDTMPLHCSYGQMGFVVYTHFPYSILQCKIEYDWEKKEVTINEEPYRQFLNGLCLEENCPNRNFVGYLIYKDGSAELKLCTDAGEDMNVWLDVFDREHLQEYIDGFDINEEVLLWWQGGGNGAYARNVPFSNIKEHYEDYEAYLSLLQKVCDHLVC
jgi:hypothetical protein